MSESSSFIQIIASENSQQFSELLTLLEQRLPKSCFVYNAVKISPRFPQHSKIFLLNPESSDSKINLNSWLVLTHFTEDQGQNILISAPSKNEDQYSPQQKDNLIEIFSSCNIFNWEEPHWFVALDVWVSRLVSLISIERKGHSIEIHPDTLMYMDKDSEILNQLESELKTSSENHPHLDIKRLDSKYGTEFLTSTWKFSKPNSSLPITRFLELNESGGVYLKGSPQQPVSGLLLHGSGLLSMLYTLEEQRGKGLAKLGMKLAAREMLKGGLYPASTVDTWNSPSLNAHYQLGFKSGGLVPWVMYAPSKEKLKVLSLLK